MRWLKRGIALGVMALGLGCLNYTNGFGLEHHAKWAAERGFPAPSYGIFVLGAALAVLGAGMVGFTLAPARRGSAAAAVDPQP